MAIAEKINASVINVTDIKTPIELDSFDLIGFGAGIDSGKHYPEMLKFADTLNNIQNKKAFIFSTSGVYTYKKMVKDHTALRTLLQNKGFKIVDEFGCKGLNTNSILKYFGGMNKSRPNSEDIKNAKTFAEKLLK